MRLQVDNEFQQVKLKDVSDQNNVEMFTTSARGGKAFAAEQKIRELKTRISKLNTQKLKISPTKIILSSADNMNSVQSEKYSLSPDEIEKKSLFNVRFRTLSNFHRIQRTKLVNDRLDTYDKKKYKAKRRKLRENLKIGEEVLVLAERIRKKSAPGKFYKQPAQNISYFNKEKTISIRKKQKTEKIDYYYCLKNLETKRNLRKRFQRTEVFAIKIILLCRFD